MSIKTISLAEYKIEGILFDMDGTLTNTEDAYKAIFYECVEDMKRLHPGEFDDFPDFEGGMETIHIAQSWIDKNSEKRTALYQEFYDLYKSLKPPVSGEKAFLMEDVPRILQQVEFVRTQVALVTSSYQYQYEGFAKLNGLENFFHTAVWKESVTKRKPHPEPYILGMSNLGVAPENALVFEDSRVGIISAVRAKARVIVWRNEGQMPLPSELQDELETQNTEIVEVQNYRELKIAA